MLPSVKTTLRTVGTVVSTVFLLASLLLEIKILPIVLYGGLVTAKLQEEKDKIIKIFKRQKILRFLCGVLRIIKNK